MASSLTPPVLPPTSKGWAGAVTKALNEFFNKLCKQFNNTLAVGPAIASASTITPSNAIHHVTGTTEIETIAVPSTFAGTITLIPDALWTTGTSGNIAVASTAVVGKPITFQYDPAKQTFYPSY